MYYIYVIRVEGGALYTGIAKSMFSRMAEHFGQGKRSAKFTRSRKICSLEALWSCESRSLASRLEYSFKTLKKAEKESVLRSPNRLFSLLPQLEREDFVFHPLANLSLFLGKINLTDLP